MPQTSRRPARPLARIVSTALAAAVTVALAAIPSQAAPNQAAPNQAAPNQAAPNQARGSQAAGDQAGLNRPAEQQTGRHHDGSGSVPPPVPLPADPKGLPPPGPMGKAIDPVATYQPQNDCESKAMPGILKLRALALSTYGRGGTSPATPRACATGGISEHYDGRAWDWMVNYYNKADRRAAANFLSWLTGPGPSGQPAEMAPRLGVMYVIYNHEIWSAYYGYWRNYTGSDPHTSHIHISLTWNGARAHTSFWTGRVWPIDYGTCVVFAGQPGTVVPKKPRTTPCPAPAPLVRSSTQSLGWLGSSGSQVAAAQSSLGITPTGTFGAKTRHAVLRYQTAHDLPRTGALDDPTWASLQPATATLNAPSWRPAKAAAWGRSHGSPTLARHNAGLSVYAVQVALRLPRAERSGFFGRHTAAAVLAANQRFGLPATAKVTAALWSRLPL